MNANVNNLDIAFLAEKIGDFAAYAFWVTAVLSSVLGALIVFLINFPAIDWLGPIFAANAFTMLSSIILMAVCSKVVKEIA